MCSLGKLKTVKDFCAFRQREARSAPLCKLALHNAEWAICPCTTHLSLSARNTKLGDALWDPSRSSGGLAPAAAVGMWPWPSARGEAGWPNLTVHWQLQGLPGAEVLLPLQGQTGVLGLVLSLAPAVQSLWYGFWQSLWHRRHCWGAGMWGELSFLSDSCHRCESGRGLHWLLTTQTSLQLFLAS